MSDEVLIIDDDPAFRRAWGKILSAHGYRPVDAGTAPDGLTAFRRSSAKLVVLDLMLPPGNTPEVGAQVLTELLTLRPDAKVVVASGAGEASLALSLVRRGAYDFIAKPVDPDVLLAVLERARARLTLEARVQQLEASLSETHGGLIGSAPSFLEAKRLAERAAATEVPLLLTGASGTGKEVFARFVHASSRRASGPFVAVNCGAIAPTLLESTLFGHKKGSFTGATTDAKGLFLEADDGTLFLDEIGDLALDLQVKLLRALEAREVLPVGASKPVPIDVRVLSATHQPLAQKCAEKTFRDDLYWRIRGIEVELPRLADRAGDVLVLAKHFLTQARALVPTAGPVSISGEAARALEAHDWPGNLRELRNEMQRALVMSGGRGEILLDDLSAHFRSKTSAEPSPTAFTLEEKIAALERSEISRALTESGGNKTHAAERLGLSRQGLLNKLARYGL